MGLRLHKVIGWALTDLLPGKDGWGHADPRVNWEAEPFGHDGRTGREYLPWLAKRVADRRLPGLEQWFSLDHAMLRDPATLGRLGGKGVWESVTYDTEGGLPTVLVIRPFTLPDWSRTDDSIDYAAETNMTGTLMGDRAWVLPLRNGIHPYNGVYMDAETGENLPHQAVQWARLRNGLADQGADPEEAERVLTKAAPLFTPYKTYAEAQARVVQRVPLEVRDVAEYLGLFTHAGVWRQLRPVLYTYWA
jgi:hypothetical protein